MSAEATGTVFPAVLPAVLRDLGTEDYESVWALQKELVAQRQADAIPDTLIFCEHPHVLTLGRRQQARQNVLADDMPVVEVERGGDVTYHGPGQLVGYLILKLEGEGRDLHAFLRAIEEALIRVSVRFGLPAGRRPGYTGVWVGDRKLVSIGIAVRRWVSFHGFALNVSTDLARFRAINPCGLESQVMTSLSDLLGRPISVEEVKPLCADALGAALGRRFVSAAASAQVQHGADKPGLRASLDSVD